MQIKDSENEKEEAESKICQLQTLLEKEKARLEERLSDLEKAKELLLDSKVDLQHQLDSSKSDAKTLQEQLEKLKVEKEKIADTFSREIETLKKDYCQQLSEKNSAKEKLEGDLANLEKEMEAAKHNLEASDIKVSEIESRLTEQNRQIDKALSDRLELEAKVESASDERRSLLERCLGAEGELDRSRSTIVELRRKLDDSQAALHELGRENQSIQVELAKQSGRKWADDSEVNSCITCNSIFTITNRKVPTYICFREAFVGFSTYEMHLVFFSITAEIAVKYFAQIAPLKGPQCPTSKILNEFVMAVMVSLFVQCLNYSSARNSKIFL